MTLAEVLARRDLPGFVELLDPDVVWQGIAPDAVCRNRDEVRELLERYLASGRAAAPEIVVETGDAVVVDPHAEAAVPELHHVYTLRDGRIVRMQDFPDRSSALAAVGRAHTFGGTWPYEPRWLETDGVHLHYVDEGSRNGEPVVMLHGVPTWSYLYRRFIPPLVEHGFRAIAYDQLGFGRSDKPAATDAYTLERWIRHLDALVDELELEKITLVMHDWGGPVGLGWAVDHVERVKRLVLFNTGTGAVDEGPAPLGYALLRAPLLGDVLTRGANAFRFALLYAADLDDDAKAAYAKPHPSWKTRAGLAKAPRMLPFDSGNPSREIVRHTVDELGRLYAKPKLVVWGMKDPVLRPHILKNLRQRLGQAEVRELRDVSHFVQEDAPDDAIRYVLEFLERTK
jgi:haloalkane dehalogenase